MIVLPPLPYAHDALEPVLSARTLELHHARHHAHYVDTANTLLADCGAADEDLETVVRRARADNDQSLFNNAAQAWNHAFFWAGMRPYGHKDGPLDPALEEAVRTGFGDLEALKAAMVKEGGGHFASGWVWLIAEDQTLAVISTHDADSVLTQPGVTPLLVCDLWEHAYYLDHENDRKGFIAAWFEDLANWDFAAGQLAAAQGRDAPWTYPRPVPDA